MDWELQDYLSFIWCSDPGPPLSKQDHEDFVSYCANVLEHLWWVRNEICFKEVKVSLEDSVQHVRNKFQEFKNAFRRIESEGETRMDAN